MIFDFLTRLGLGDENYVTVACILGIVILYAIYKLLKKSDDGSPKPIPGPIGFPIVGYFPFLGSKPYTVLAKLALKYGGVFQVRLGAKPCLVLGSYEAIRDAAIKQSEIYSGRPYIALKVFENETAFIFDEGPTFKDVRMFSMDVLKRLGFGRLSLEPMVKVEVQDLINKIKGYNGEPTDVCHSMEQSVGNAICTLLSGKRSPLDDSWLRRLIDAVNGLRDTTTHDHSFYFPWLKAIPFISKLTNEKERIYWKKEMWSVWKEKIEDVKKDMASGKASESYISAWYKESEKREQTSAPNKHLYSEFNLVSNLDIFAQASFETTSTTILWAIQYMINSPEVQDKIYAEIIKNLRGGEFDLSFIEAKDMPYTKAFIQETHRLSSISPLGIFHRTTADSVLMGYKVPADILVMLCDYAVHYDPANFPEPSKFKPERFLTENGEFIRSEKVIPFAVGKRFCPGEFVAQMEIFHYLTAVVYHFKLELGPNNENYGESSNKTLIRYPMPFTVKFIPRHK